MGGELSGHVHRGMKGSNAVISPVKDMQFEDGMIIEMIKLFPTKAIYHEVY